MLGNNVNGILHWNVLFTKYETVIRQAFEFHDTYLQSANKKMNRIRNRALKSYLMLYSGSKKKIKTTMLPKDLFKPIYVGVHIR